MENGNEEITGSVVKRERWIKILKLLNDSQYQNCNRGRFLKALGMDANIVCANIDHLRTHGLVDASIYKTSLGGCIFSDAEITPKGVEYLSKDGGLKAELNVVSVNFDVSQLQMLIEAHINASGAPQTVKKKLQDALKHLPADDLKSIISELIKRGLSSSPELIHWLETMMDY